jgi:hypothetical protein
MTLHRFTTGGFVLHKVHIVGSPCRFSAWFNTIGDLIDAEGFNTLGHRHDVKKHSAAWVELSRIGKRYVLPEFLPADSHPGWQRLESAIENAD